jgi:cellulose synthase/poly-beta-1,6-N-acetylglucosamine synthase-like glycosyltransferase
VLSSGDQKNPHLLAAWLTASTAYLLLRLYSHISAFCRGFRLSQHTGFLALFMFILVIRYFVLIIFSYLEHLDNIRNSEPETIDGPTPESDSKLPFITIIVPAYNEGRIIQTAIRSLLEIDYPYYEVLVVDDGSTDDTYERAREMVRVMTNASITVLTKPSSGKPTRSIPEWPTRRAIFILCMDGDTRLSEYAARLHRTF